MRESQLYSQFLRRNILLLGVPIIVCLLISVYFYAKVPTYSRISQTFKLNYDFENINTILALNDQAISELRTQRFQDSFSEASVSIYKSAPLSISIEATTLNRETSYSLLLKETEYLRQNFQVEELTGPSINVIEPNLFKYLISGLIVGGLIGLIIALIREYIKNY